MSGDDIALKATLDASGVASGMQSINGHLNDLGMKTGTASMNLGALGTVMGTLANPMTAFALAATTAGAALAGSVAAAASWQSGMANVSKTTGLAGADLAGLSKELLDMSTKMPTAASDLQNIAAVAGSLGVAKENIAGFTEVAAQMAVGFEMPAEVAATSAAKILTAYGKPIDASNMKALGNAVNALGDSTAATEPQILDFVNRASFLGTTFNQSIPQIAALGATLISVGMDAETASTGVKSLLNIGLSETTKGKGLNAISALMGTTNEEMKKAFGEDLQGTMTEVADKLMTIQDPVERFNTAVAIAGTEGATALTKLAGQAGNLKTNLASADAEWTNGTSLMKTYEAQSATMDAQMQIFWNTVNKAGAELGTVLLPAITEGIQDMSEFVTQMTRFGEAVYTAWQNLEGMGEQVASQIATSGQGVSAWLQQFGLGYDELADPNSKTGQEYMAGKKQGETVAKAASDAIKANEDLENATGKALSSDDALKAARDAADKAAKAYTDRYGTMFAAGMAEMTDGTYRSWDAINAQKSAAAGGVTSGSSQYSATTDAGMKLNFQYTVSDTDQTATIKAEDGTILAEKNIGSRWDPGYADEVAALLASVVPDTNMGNVLDLTKGKAAGDVWRLQQKSTIELDAPTITIKSMDYKFYSAIPNEDAQKLADAYDEAFKKVDWENLSGFVEADAKLRDALSKMGTETEMAPTMAGLDAKMAEYKAELAASITDIAAFAKTQSADLGKQIIDSMADNVISGDDRKLYTAMIPMLETIKTESPKDFGDAGLESILQFAKMAHDGATTSELVAFYKNMGLEAGKGFADAMTGTLRQINTESFADVIKNFDASKIGSMSTWLKNTEQPALKQSFDDMYKIEQTGYTQDIKAASDWITEKQKLLSQHSDWFNGWQTQLLNMEKNNQIDTDQFYYLWDQMENQSTSSNVEKTTQALKDQTVGYDNLKAAIGDCAECAMSDFGTWQEAQDGLFQDSYISQGGQSYLDWKTQQVNAIAETQKAMRAAGGLVVGQDYTQNALANQEVKATLTVDTTQAITNIGIVKTDLDGIVSQAKEVPLTLKTITDQSYTDVNKLLTYIIQANPIMSVQVSVSANADEIRAEVDAAIRAALA